jgi:hypothetical protein
MRYANAPLTLALLGTLVAAIHPGAAAEGDQQNVERSAADVVIASANAGSPLDFAYALGEAGISAGIVVDADSYHPPRPGGLFTPRSMGAGTPEVGAEVDAETAARLFAAARRDYNVSVDRDVVVAYQADKKTDPMFTEKRANIDVTNVSIDDAAAALLRAIDPSIPKLGGTVGSWLGRPGELPPTPEMVRGPLVSFSLTAPTGIEALNELARQAPGTVWVLVRHVKGEEAHYTLSIRKPNQLHAQYPYSLK